MSKYNLDHFPPEEFEKFCQAMLLSLFGISLRFSHHKGPDGGADATYEGKCNVADFQDWDGYWVFQVKHHDVGYLGIRGINNAIKADIRKECKKLLSIPQLVDNYVLVTNAILYPDTVSKIRETFGKVVTIKHVEVIDYSKIEAILDNETDLRMAWQEQLGDVVNRLSLEISKLSKISTDVFSHLLGGTQEKSSASSAREHDKLVKELSNANVEGRKKLAIQLRQFASKQFVFPLLGSMAIDSMVLEIYPEMDFKSCRESLEEGFKTLAAIPSRVATLFLLGNVCYPHLAENLEDSHYTLLEDMAFRSLNTMDPEKVAADCVWLFGVLRAKYGIWHLGSRNSDRRKDIAEWTLTIRNLIGKTKVDDLHLPGWRNILQTVKCTFDVEGEYVYVSPEEIKAIRQSFEKILNLPKMNTLNIDDIKMGELATYCLMEDVYGITGEEWDLRPDSPFEKKHQVVMKVLERKLCSILIAAGKLSEEEFTNRSEFTELTESYWHRKFEAGECWFNDPPYEFLTVSVLKTDFKSDLES